MKRGSRPLEGGALSGAPRMRRRPDEKGIKTGLHTVDVHRVLMRRRPDEKGIKTFLVSRIQCTNDETQTR